jgi:hypothetical protein
VSYRTVLRQIREGTFPPPIVLSENRRGVLKSDLTKWLEERAAQRPSNAWLRAHAAATAPPKAKSTFPPKAGEGTRRKIRQQAARAGRRPNTDKAPGGSPLAEGDRPAAGKEVAYAE